MTFGKVVKALADEDVRPGSHVKLYLDTTKTIVVDCCVALVYIAEEEEWDISKLRKQLVFILTYAVHTMKVDCQPFAPVATCAFQLMSPSGCSTSYL